MKFVNYPGWNLSISTISIVAVEAVETVMAFFADLSKALDAVEPAVLLDKLASVGITGKNIEMAYIMLDRASTNHWNETKKLFS